MRRCFLLIALSLLPISGFAQSTSATISGGVTDTSGSFILGADVEIANDATGVIYSAKTNDSGMYLLPILPPGHYHVQVSKPGFKTIIKADITLHVQSALALNFTLPVGATSETITVEAGSSLLNTTDASVSTVIDRKFVQNIPLNGRSFQDLISLTPGVVTQSPQASTFVAGSGDFSVNGQRTESNYYMVDGVAGNVSSGRGLGLPGPSDSGTLAATTALGTTQSLVSVDALQEFRVDTSTYSAEYGRTPGGQFSLSTRSGTEELHGTAFDYLRNNFFDANDWFNDHFGMPQPALRQNDFGGTLGGPVRIPRLYSEQNKTFFFASYEGLRLQQPQAATLQYVPDRLLRQEAPSALQPILNAFPLPSSGGVDYSSEGLAQFFEPYSNPSQIDATSVRIDRTLSQKLTMFFRFSDTPSSTASRILSALTQTVIDTRTYTFGTDSQFSSSMNNQLRFEYAAGNSSSKGSLDAFAGATPIDFAQAIGDAAYSNAGADFTYSVTGIGVSELTTRSSNTNTNQWNVTDSFGVLAGKHELKFGADYRRMTSDLNPVLMYVSGNFITEQSVLSNQPFITLLDEQLGSTPIFNELAIYAQDEWRVRPCMSLSLGLRWEVDPPPTGAHGDDAFTTLGNVVDPSTFTVAPRGTSLWNTSWFNFAPRLGVAWTANARSGWETILRSGGGVFFDTDDQLATEGFEELGFSAYQYAFQTPLPVTSAQLDFSPSVNAPYTSSTITAFPRQLQLPYTLQWNVSLEQALGKEQALTLSYVGSNGRRLLQINELYLNSLNPNFGYVDVLQTGVTSNYQAAQVQFQRSVSHGLHALAAYTWSHSIDFGSNDDALSATRGNSDFDVRNNFQGGLSWDIPRVETGRKVSVLTHDWGLDARLMARTAFPITLQGNFLTDPATGSRYYGNVDLVPGQPIYLYGNEYPGGRAVNPGAFSLPSGSGAGTAPRNFVRGFGEEQMNVAVRRQFPIFDQLSLQFRAEAFNVLNHPNFGYVDPTLTDATFGTATMMLNQSLGTLSSQYQQGGPRSMQFALKLQF